MRKFYFFVFLLTISSNFVFGQNIDELTKKRDSLNIVLKDIDSQIIKLENEKQRTKNEITYIIQRIDRIEIQKQLNKGIPVTINFMGGTLRDNPAGDVLLKIPPDDTVIVLDHYEEPYFRVIYKDKIGFLSYICFNENEIIKSKINTGKPRVSRLAELYGAEAERKIKNREYWLGMTDAMAKESLGEPDDINRTINAWGTYEQWVYSHPTRYLYFENGKLTSIQE